MGGVGGTVTVLNYGYWIKESGRLSISDLKVCRLDLMVGYTMTAIFGIAMVIIGSTITVEGKGAGLIMNISHSLAQKSGPLGTWTFLIGAWSAIFSSLLGVWQGVPYLFADIWRCLEKQKGRAESTISTTSRSYQWYLYALGIIPILGLWVGFAHMQKLYAIVGALFMPMLAIVLLIFNTRTDWMGRAHRNHRITNLFLTVILLFFLWMGVLTVIKIFS